MKSETVNFSKNDTVNVVVPDEGTRGLFAYYKGMEGEHTISEVWAQFNLIRLANGFWVPQGWCTHVAKAEG